MTSPLGILSADQIEDLTPHCDWDGDKPAAWTAVWAMPCNHANERLLCDEHAAAARCGDALITSLKSACWRCTECHVPGRLASLDPL